MQTGIEAAKEVLVEIRLLTGSVAATGRAANLASIAGMIELAVPRDRVARAGFYLALGEYLASALEGAAVDPELLCVEPVSQACRECA